MTDLGLNQQDLDIIISVINRFPEVKQALIFGSRAKNNFRYGSDVDIALKGSELNLNIVSQISYQLNEDTILPYRFDVLNYNSIVSAELKEHIDRVGVTVFEKPEPLTRFNNSK